MIHLNRVFPKKQYIGFVIINLTPQPLPEYPVVETLLTNIQDWSTMGCQSFRTESSVEAYFQPKIKLHTDGTLWFSNGHNVR